MLQYFLVVCFVQFFVKFADPHAVSWFILFRRRVDTNFISENERSTSAVGGGINVAISIKRVMSG